MALDTVKDLKKKANVLFTLLDQLLKKDQATVIKEYTKVQKDISSYSITQEELILKK